MYTSGDKTLNDVNVVGVNYHENIGEIYIEVHAISGKKSSIPSSLKVHQEKYEPVNDSIFFSSP